jgi:nicotinate-nucleotide adenylyltransferase
MREGKSYTIDTINYFRNNLGEEPIFLAGWDAFLDMPGWHKAEELITTCNIAVIDREGEQREPFADVATKLLETIGGKHDFKIIKPDTGKREKLLFGKNKNFITIVPVPRLDISSSDIRRRLETGEPVRYLVPESVMEFIGEKSE